MTDFEPIGFDDPVKALSMLERLRKQDGDHLKLYHAIPVGQQLLLKSEQEEYNQRQGFSDFDYSLIREYLREEDE